MLGLSPWVQLPVRGSTHKGNQSHVGANVFLQLFWWVLRAGLLALELWPREAEHITQGHTACLTLSQLGWGNSLWPGAHQVGRKPGLTCTLCIQKYKKAKNPSPATRPVSRRCAINARNALTALFTSGGRTPTQPSTQDTAKTPSKVTAQPAQHPLPRRSSRLKT